MLIRKVRGFTPKIDQAAFVAENAVIIGDVELGPKSSVWYNVTLRGDVMPIRIGAESNVQDGTVIHGTYGKYGTTLRERVTIGHLVLLHGCEIGRGCLIGMGSIIMDNVKIGANSIIGAGSLVTEGKSFPENSLIMGRPAKWVRQLREDELKNLEQSANNYLLYSEWYRE